MGNIGRRRRRIEVLPSEPTTAPAEVPTPAPERPAQPQPKVPEPSR